MPEGIYKEIKAVYKRNRRQRTFDMGHRIIFATGNEERCGRYALYWLIWVFPYFP